MKEDYFNALVRSECTCSRFLCLWYPFEESGTFVWFVHAL